MQKKRIKHLLGTKSAILCNSEEEWDQLIQLTSSPSPNYYNVSSNKLFDLFTAGTTWTCTSYSTIVRHKSRTIYQFSDFIDNFFIKGKWYKGNTNSYMKFDYYSNGKYYISGRVICGDYTEQKKDYWSNLDYINTAIKYGEVDISEIEEYLPSNHPDIIKKKWYIKVDENNRKDIKSFFDTKGGHYFLYTPGFYYWFDEYNKCKANDRKTAIPASYTEVNTKDFYKHILKKDKEPVKAPNEFKKDDYIVLLKYFSPAFLKNFIYKQRKDYPYFRPYLDTEGSSTNGRKDIIRKNNSNWRFATTNEINLYNFKHKPCETNSLTLNNGIFNELKVEGQLAIIETDCLSLTSNTLTIPKLKKPKRQLLDIQLNTEFQKLDLKLKKNPVKQVKQFQITKLKIKI